MKISTTKRRKSRLCFIQALVQVRVRYRIFDGKQRHDKNKFRLASLYMNCDIMALSTLLKYYNSGLYNSVRPLIRRMSRNG